jgi:hypothetical protein
MVMAASPAASLSSVGLSWRGTTSNEIFKSSTVDETVIADIVLTVEAGASDVLFIGISIAWDEDSANELNLVSVNELNNVALPGGGNFFAPLVNGTSLNGDMVEGFDQAAELGQPGAQGPITRTIGSITFTTNAANLQGSASEGADVRVLVQLNGIDVIGDTSGNRCIGELSRNDCPYDLGELKVNTPEPTTSALIVLGLGIGAFYNRRR